MFFAIAVIGERGSRTISQVMQPNPRPQIREFMPETRSTWHWSRKIPQLLAGWSYIDDIVSNAISGPESLSQHFPFLGDFSVAVWGSVVSLQANREGGPGGMSVSEG